MPRERANRRDLDALFQPASVAVVGASERATSSGGAVLRMLVKSGFPGRIVPVNPGVETVLGLPAKASLKEVEPPCDLAVIVIRPDLILEAVRDAAASGHRALLILPGGFAEAGEAGLAREAELKGLAAEAGLLVAGPNCAGIISLAAECPFAATFLRDLPPGGGLAFVSQSGAIAEELIAKAQERHLPLGTVVSVGNGLHLGIEEHLAYLGRRPDVSGLLLYVESIADRERFIALASDIAAEKPVVALIGGRTEAGGRAALNHTGATALSEAEAEDFARQAGILRVTSLRRLLLAAKGFGFFPRGLGHRLLLLSNSGGPGVIATDRLEAEGLELPPLPPALEAHYRALLPAEAAVANPMDLLADAREERFGDCLSEALSAAEGWIDALAMIHVVPFMVEAGPVIARLAAIARRSRLPIFHSMMGTLPEKAAWFETMEAAGVPMFNDVEEMAETIGLLARYRRNVKAQPKKKKLPQ